MKSLRVRAPYPHFALRLLFIAAICLALPQKLPAQSTFLSSAALNFGSAKVCATGQTSSAACTRTLSLSYELNPGARARGIKVLTEGVPNLDFTLAGNPSACNALTCSLQIAFAPKFPGLRLGAVEIFDTSGNLLATTYLAGVGVGPQIPFRPGSLSTIGNNFQTPQAITSDAAGNTFIADRSLGVVRVSAGGTQTAIGSRIGDARGVAIDGAGNIFVVDRLHGLVAEISAVSGAQTTLLSDLNAPSGIAIDGGHSLYIADSSNNRLLKINPDGKQLVLGAGLRSPQAVALDSSGNIFVADSGNNQIVEIPADGGSQIVVADGLNAPAGLAVDAAGNLFIADTGNNRILELHAGSATPIVLPTGTQLSHPMSVAVGAADQLLIADTYNLRVLQLAAAQPLSLNNSGLATPAASGSPINQTITFPLLAPVTPGVSESLAATASSGMPVTYTSSTPLICTVSGNTVTFGAAGFCAVTASQAGSSAYNPASATQEITVAATFAFSGAQNFGSVNVGASQALQIGITGSSGVLGKVKVVTDGLPNLDFTLGTNNCSAGVKTCTASVVFTPKAPGLRKGALQITNATGIVVATAYLAGNGIGPQISFGPGVQTTVSTGFGAPYGIAVDAAGDVFVVDPVNNNLLEMPAGGGAQLTVPLNGLSFSSGIAVDGVGNVFVVDSNNSRVIEIPAATGTQITVGTGFYYPWGIAADGLGNLFIADSANNRVVKLQLATGAQTSVGSGLIYPLGVAVDASGNVFIVDSGNDRVVKVQGGTGVQTTLFTGPDNYGPLPSSIALDAAGDLFIVDNGVVEILAATGQQLPFVIGPSDFYASCIAIDGRGDVYLGDDDNGTLIKLERSQPPTLGFAPTYLGQTSSDSPQLLTVGNSGNVPLNIMALTVGANFTQAKTSGALLDCMATASLASGAACNLSLSFAPATAGSLTSSAVLTDNLNPPAQSISLLGLGQAGTKSQTVTFSLQPVTVGDDVILRATSSSGLPVTFTSSTPSVCTIAGSTATFLATGTCTVTASQLGSVTYAPASTTQNVTVTSTLTYSGSTAGFASVRVGATQTATLTYGVPSNGSVANVKVLTDGMPNLDFTLAAGSTCVGNPAANSTCTVNIAFTPKAPGLRRGAVQILDGSGVIVATNFISGVGFGPQIAFGPGVHSPLGRGTGFANALAVDAAGNIFIAANQLLELPPGASAPVIIPIAGLNYAAGVAVDGAGNIFVSDPENNRVVKLQAGTGVQATVGSGLAGPGGLAVDGNGNLFIADSYNNRVLTVQSANGAQTTVGNGLFYPRSVALDAAGDVLIYDGTGRVFEVQAGTGVQTTVFSAFGSITGLAVDAAGDLFIAEAGSPVIELLAGSDRQLTVVDSSLGYDPTCVALDSNGNAFIGFSNGVGIIEFQRSQPPSLTFAPTHTGFTSSDSPQSLAISNSGNASFTISSLTVGANFTRVKGSGTPADCTATALAPGTACNLSLSFTPSIAGSLTSSFVLTDNLSPTTQTISLSGVAQNGAQTQTISFPSIQPVTIGTTVTLAATASSGLPVAFASSPATVCTNSSVIVTFFTSGNCTITASQSGSNTYLPATASQTIAITEPLTFSGSTSITSSHSTLTYNVPLLGSVAGVNVVTDGLPNLDFTLGSGSTCVGHPAANTTCTVNINFSAKAAGLRKGAVQITNGSGIVVATAFISAISSAPRLSFAHSVQTTVGSGLAQPSAIAIDAGGNIFIADSINNRVVKLQAGTGVQTTVGSGLSLPQGVAVDGLGNVFIADSGNAQVVEVSAGKGVQTTVTPGIYFPLGVAVDGMGNLYVANSGENEIIKIQPATGAQTSIGTGLNQPTAIALNNYGDLFIADTGNNRVVKISASTGNQFIIGSGLNQPSGVVVDPAGNVFISDTGNSRIVEVHVGGSQMSVEHSGLNYPSGLAIDAAGNLYIAEVNNNRILELGYSQPPTLSFAATAVGKTSADSPQSLTIGNNGNVSLDITGLTVSPNFTQVPGSGTPADCTSSTTLAAGASCNLSLSFKPAATGPLSGSAVLTDSLGVQSVTVLGTGVAPAASISAINP